jgi:hypothetical protein
MCCNVRLAVRKLNPHVYGMHAIADSLIVNEQHWYVYLPSCMYCNGYACMHAASLYKLGIDWVMSTGSCWVQSGYRS